MTRIVVAALCAAVALTGCGAETTQPSGQRTVTSKRVVVSATARGAASGAVAKPVARQLSFTAKTLDGAEFSGASLVGKPVVIWFWAPRCPRCQGEAADIAAAAKETAGKVSFLGVASRDEVPAMKTFVERNGLGSFPHIADGDGAVWQRFGVVEQPAHAFIKPNGMVEMVLRQLPTEELLAKVRALAG